MGAVPLLPDFGCDAWRHLDAPSSRAIPGAVREVTKALRRWEPRVQVLKVAVRHAGGVPVLQVVWRPHSTAPALSASTTVTTLVSRAQPAQAGVPGGLATLGADGLLSPSQRPPVELELDGGEVV